MIKIRRGWTLVAALAAAGCAMESGVLPMGPDTYTISEHYAPIRGGVLSAEKAALTEANDFCQAKGLQFVPLATAESVAPIQAIYGNTNYHVTFRCLSAKAAGSAEKP